MLSSKRLVPLAVLYVTGCASTEIVGAWRDPNVQSHDLKRVLVIAEGRSPSLRRAAEDELVKKVTNGVPSYTLLSEAQLSNEDEIQRAVAAGDFDGVVVLRVLSVDRQASWRPGPSYYGYAHEGWRHPYDPSRVQIDTLVRVDTNVFANGQLAWSAESRTTNPASVNALVKETAAAVAKEMGNEGMIH